MPLAKILCCWLLICLAQGQNIIPVEFECPPCDCDSGKIECIESEIKDPCNCCHKCFRSKGERCGEKEGECSRDLLCLPDDPYSASFSGKCYEITPCLTFGCAEASDETCECYYNNVCPMQRLPYYTKEECEDAIKIKKCKNVICPSDVDGKTCKDGMYFEEGPSQLDHCCPVKGRCICNVSLCRDPPQCPQGREVAMTQSAEPEKGICCNEYICELIPGCQYKGIHHSVGETWADTKCTTCECTSNGVECLPINNNCTVLECSSTYIPDGECCPVCIDTPATTDIPTTINVPSVAICISEGGNEYNEGDIWEQTSCKYCKCINGEIQCSEKVCDAIICKTGQDYFLPEGACCPICKDITTRPIDVSIATVPMPTKIPPAGTPSMRPSTLMMPTPSNHKPSTMTQPIATNTVHKRLVLLLNVPYEKVMTKWSQFSKELEMKLKDSKIAVEDITIRQDTSTAVNATVVTVSLLELTADTSTSVESQVAVTINEMAVDYSILTPQDNKAPTVVKEYNTYQANEMELTATIIVLTLLAAISLVCFIGIVIVLVVINRKLKTAKAIRGIPTKPARKP